MIKPKSSRKSISLLAEMHSSREMMPCRSPQAGIGGSSIVGVSISKGVGADAPISVEIVIETAAGTNFMALY